MQAELNAEWTQDEKLHRDFQSQLRNACSRGWLTLRKNERGQAFILLLNGPARASATKPYARISCEFTESPAR
jgi:hypothetical protein